MSGFCPWSAKLAVALNNKLCYKLWSYINWNFETMKLDEAATCKPISVMIV